MADTGVVGVTKTREHGGEKQEGRTKLIDVTDKRMKSLAKGLESSWRDMEMKKKREE